jgi:putative FmdB family regulatory protein
MPIYEYVCMKCESHFEELVSLGASDPDCPDCGGAKVSKQFSTFASSVATSDAAPLGGRSTGGGCCGGSCGCGH